MDNYFVELYGVNVNDKVEKKNGLSYVSWPFAWAEVKKRHPDATYTIYENREGLFYHTDGSTCWVKTGVTVNGIEHIEYLPVMDFKNKSIPAASVTSMDVNKAIQRSLTKACARHGLGLYIYAGEDLPEEESDKAEKPKAKPAPIPETQIPMQSVAVPDDEKPTPEQLADLWEMIPDDGSREKTQAAYGKGFERMTLRAYNAIVAKCHKLREAGA